MSPRELTVKLDFDFERYERLLEETFKAMAKAKGDEIMAKAKSPFKKGRKVGGASSGGSQFLGLKDGESHVLAPLYGLDELISADMHEYWDIRPAIFHPCIGRNCPGCEVGNEARFKGYYPVLLKSGEVAIYPFTISVYNQLEAIEDAMDDGETLQGFVLKISRKGTGLSTRYTVVPVGKRLDVSDTEIPDFIPQLGPQTKKEIVALLEDKGFEVGGTTPVVKMETESAAGTATADTGTDDEDDDWGDA
jgi:hypothetical protein